MLKLNVYSNYKTFVTLESSQMPIRFTFSEQRLQAALEISNLVECLSRRGTRPGRAYPGCVDCSNPTRSWPSDPLARSLCILGT